MAEEDNLWTMWNLSTFKSKENKPPPICQLFSILLPIVGSLNNWSDQWLSPRFATISMGQGLFVWKWMLVFKGIMTTVLTNIVTNKLFVSVVRLRKPNPILLQLEQQFIGQKLCSKFGQFFVVVSFCLLSVSSAKKLA